MHDIGFIMTGNEQSLKPDGEKEKEHTKAPEGHILESSDGLSTPSKDEGKAAVRTDVEIRDTIVIPRGTTGIKHVMLPQPPTLEEGKVIPAIDPADENTDDKSSQKK